MQMSNVAICLLVCGANFLLIYKMHDSRDVCLGTFFFVTKKFNFNFNLTLATVIAATQYWKSLPAAAAEYMYYRTTPARRYF